MLNLLKTEYKKLIPYPTFWVIFGFFLLFTPIVFFAVGQIKLESFQVDLAVIYNFPEVWNNITYTASWFNLLIGMLLVILICNEYAFKTFRQHVIDGQSKSDFIISKILLISSFSLLTTLYLFIVGALFGLLSGSDVDLLLTDTKYLFIYFIQSLGYMSLGLIIAVTIRSSALSIILFICSIFFEFIIRSLIPDNIDKFFPMKIISNLTPIPAPEGVQMDSLVESLPLNANLAIAVVYILIFWGLSYFIIANKDIK